MLWLGGWWLFTLVAVAACRRRARVRDDGAPAAPARAGGLRRRAAGAVRRARAAGSCGCSAGFLATFVLGFVLHALSSTRAPTTAAVGSTDSRLGVDRARARLCPPPARDARPGTAHRLRRRPDRVRRRRPSPTSPAGCSAATGSRRACRRRRSWEGLAGRRRRRRLRRLHRALRHARRVPGVWQAIVLGVVVVVAAVIGDLFESALKRDLEVKDTGRLLGGHGGVLDRDRRAPLRRAGRVLPRRRVRLPSRRLTPYTGPVKRVALLGATGSIGRQAIEIVEAHPELELCAAASGSTPLDDVDAPLKEVGGDLTELLERAAARRRPQCRRRLRGRPRDALGARARRRSRAREQGEPRRSRRARPRGTRAGPRPDPAGRQRALRALPVPRGTRAGADRHARDHRLGRPVPRPHAHRARGRRRPSRRSHIRLGAWGRRSLWTPQRSRTKGSR